jgi:hypothetical protein
MLFLGLGFERGGRQSQDLGGVLGREAGALGHIEGVDPLLI